MRARRRRNPSRVIVPSLLLAGAFRTALGQGSGSIPPDLTTDPYYTSGSGTGGSSQGESCDFSGTGADYSETLSGSNSTTERAVASATGCPNHVNWPLNPNNAMEISSDEVIPAYPMLFEAGGTTDLSATEGQVGIMLNGVALFSSWAAGVADSYESSAFAVEGDTFDVCGGHATEQGWYHYHSVAGCLQEQAMEAAGTTASEHSPQLGWAYDGFPVYGQLGPDGVEMLVCGNDGADATYCLDSCSGYEGELAGVDGFMYRYYTSCGFDEAYFPFTTNCYRGCCPTGMTCAAAVESCGDSPDDGFTADYTPETAAILSAQYETDLYAGNDSELIFSEVSVDCSLFLGSYTDVTTTDSSVTLTPTPTVLTTTPAPTATSTTPVPTAAAATPIPTATIEDETNPPLAADISTDPPAITPPDVTNSTAAPAPTGTSEPLAGEDNKASTSTGQSSVLMASAAVFVVTSFCSTTVIFF